MGCHLTQELSLYRHESRSVTVFYRQTRDDWELTRERPADMTGWAKYVLPPADEFLPGGLERVAAALRAQADLHQQEVLANRPDPQPPAGITIQQLAEMRRTMGWASIAKNLRVSQSTLYRFWKRHYDREYRRVRTANEAAIAAGEAPCDEAEASTPSGRIVRRARYHRGL